MVSEWCALAIDRFSGEETLVSSEEGSVRKGGNPRRKHLKGNENDIVIFIEIVKSDIFLICSDCRGSNLLSVAPSSRNYVLEIFSS